MATTQELFDEMRRVIQGGSSNTTLMITNFTTLLEELYKGSAPNINLVEADADVELTPANGVAVIDATGGARTVTLPVASSLVSDEDSAVKFLYIKKSDAGGNAVTIEAADGETIEGQPDYTLDAPGGSVILVPAGDTWLTIAGTDAIQADLSTVETEVAELTSTVTSMRDPRLGRLLFDLTSTSQLDSPGKYQRNTGSTGGGNGDTATTIGTTVLTGNLARVGQVFRITATSLAGGAVFGVKNSELPGGVLPAKYVIYMELIQASAAGLFCGPMLFYRPAASDFQGCIIEHNSGSASRNVRPIVDDQVGSTAESLQSAGAWSVPNAGVRGGFRMWVEVCRQQGDATALATVRCVAENGDNGQGVDGSEVTAIAAVGANWNSLDLNRCGIAVQESVNGTSGTFDFKKFQIYAHPWD